MTIESALLSAYPDQIIGEPVRLGSRLFLEMDSNAISRDETGYWVAREDTTEIIFKFNPSGVVYVYNDVTLTSHEKRVVTKIISMWRKHMRPDWETFESMRRHSTVPTTLVPVVHNTF